MRDCNIILIRNSSLQSFFPNIRESFEKFLSVKSVSRKSNRIVDPVALSSYIDLLTLNLAKLLVCT